MIRDDSGLRSRQLVTVRIGVKVSVRTGNMNGRLPEYDWSNLRSDYRRLGSMQAVADEYGCSLNAVRYQIKEQRITVRKPVRRSSK